MGLSRTQRVTLNQTAGFEGLDLSPQEYFVLSRVEGIVTVGDVLASSGMKAEAAQKILGKLLELEVVKLVEMPQPLISAGARPSSPETMRIRQNARHRKTNLLRSQLQGNLGPATRTPQREQVVEVEQPPPVAEQACEAPPELERFEIPPVAADDPRIDTRYPIAEIEQRRLLALADGINAWSDFEVLGIMPTHDLARVRRAYHEKSRALHPDAYFGREIGPYRDLLAVLFKRAKVAYHDLQKAENRNPHVDAYIEEKAREQKVQAQREAAMKAIDDLKRKQEEEHAAKRRQERSAERARKHRSRVANNLKAESTRFAEEAEQAAEAGNLAKAANLYRLALRSDPQNEGYQARWEEVRTKARKTRAADAFQRASSYLDIGHAAEAAPLFVEAAEADPTLIHLCHAADAIRGADAAKARKFALGALDALNAPAAEHGSHYKPAELGVMHMMIARAFLAAGQTKTAQQQALLAQKHRPGDPQVRALLNSIKVT